LPALELLDTDRRGEARDLVRHEALKSLLVETMLLLHLHRADIVRAFSGHPKPLNEHSLWAEFARPFTAMQ